MHQRFFFIKFETFKDLEQAIHKGICRLPSKAFLAKMIKEILNSAYETAEIILVFSVTGSHGIQGFGKMTSEARRRFFGIRVMTFLQDNCLPLKNLSKLPNPLHRNIPVAESQFGHELPPYIGIKVCSMVEELCREAQLNGGGGFWNSLASAGDVIATPQVYSVTSPRHLPYMDSDKEDNIQMDSNSFFYFHPGHYIRASEQQPQYLRHPMCDHLNEECYSIFQKVKVNVKAPTYTKRCPFCDKYVYDYEYIYQEAA